MFVERMPKLRSLSTITNGFLPERVLTNTQAMLALTEPRRIGLSVSVSLDGVGHDHDQVRGIHGAYDKVIVTLDKLRRCASNTRSGWGSASP
jgi:MoaA/NifB/PqqE/SkfB family radical SAM enzyme